MAVLNVDRKAIGDAVNEVTPKSDIAHAFTQIFREDLTKGDYYVATYNTGSGGAFAGSYSTPRGVETNGKPVQLNAHFWTPVTLTDSEAKKLTPDTLAKQIALAALRTHDLAVSHSLTVVSNANFPVSSSYSASLFTTAAPLAQLKRHGLSITGPKVLVAGSTLVEALGANEAYVNAERLGSAVIAQTGNPKNVNTYGWTTAETALTLGTANEGGFLVGPAAVHMVSVYGEPPPTTGETRTEVIDMNGIKMLYRDFYSSDAGKWTRGVEWMGDAVAVDAGSLVHVKINPSNFS